MYLLPFIIGGLTTGSVYGLAGVGLVLTYKASGIFNFANGALATVSAFVFYTLHVQHGLAWPLALLVSVFVVGPVLGIILEWIARSLTTASLTAQVVSTVGLLLAIEATIVLIYGTTTTRQVPNFLPGHSFHLGGATITTENIVVFCVALVATLGLAGYFRWTRTGVAMRAVVDDPDLLDISGTNPSAVRRWAWIIGVTFAAASGVLVAPLVTLDATTLTFLVIQAFGAAAIGKFKNLTATYIGGLVIGIGTALCTKYFTTGLLSELAPALPFLILFIVLLVSPRGSLPYRSVKVTRVRSTWTAPLPMQLGGAAAVLVFLVLIPDIAGLHLVDWTSFLAMFIMFLSLGLLVRTSGQVSLCHVTFLAIGVVTLSHLTTSLHWPWLFALLVGGLITIPIGALLAIPAMRFPGLYLALATFGFGVFVQYMFYGQSFMFGGSGISVTVPRPHLSWISLDSDRGYYYLLLVIAVATALAIIMLNRSRLGRLLRGLADSPRGLATSGTSINITRVIVFCISAFIAGVSGGLAGGAVSAVNGLSYEPLLSLTFFALIIITVGGDPWYALLAAAGESLIPSYFTNPNVANYLQLAFGAGALLYAVTPQDRLGVPLPIRVFLDAHLRRQAPRVAVADTHAVEIAPRSLVKEGCLEVTDLRVSFGGLVAVDDVRLSAPTGRITGLIGPNGAGKTTTFNACSGLNRSIEGEITLDGHTLTHMPAAARARRGLGRTFQQMELFDSLTVRQNISLGAESRFAGVNPLGHVVAGRRQSRQVAEATEEAIAQCGLSLVAETAVGSLSTGQRRLVELARCVAGPYRIMLLDEPSSGLDRNETAHFGEILLSLVRTRGVGILLVEHDMALVNSVCDYIYVLDFGRQIFEGTHEEVQSSPLVRAAYLGEGSNDLLTDAASRVDS